MSSTGYIQVHAYTSFAQIPLQSVAVTVTAADGTALAMELTDRSGKLEPIPIPVPDLAAGLSPSAGEIPYTSVKVHAGLTGYEQITVDGVQIFPNTITIQTLEMIPFSEFPSVWDRKAFYNTPPQNL